MQTVQSTKEWYDTFYEKDNSFGYREWIYRPYLKALFAKAGLKAGLTVLDVGCGQGFFSRLIKNFGMRVTGIDISNTAVKAASRDAGATDIRFLVADPNTMPAEHTFDCLFVRSFSLYNVEDFSRNHDVTDRLMRYLKDGGTFIFAYNTNLKFTNRCGSWRYHTLKEMREHFASYSKPKCFFTLKFDILILRRLAFNQVISTVNSMLSAVLGIGGDLVCIVRKDFKSNE
jgi:ubiquinone/menaquinone biosynthesis C-methylase UbiE